MTFAECCESDEQRDKRKQGKTIEGGCRKSNWSGEFLRKSGHP